MSKLVTINLGKGSLQNGLPSIIVQLQDDVDDKSSQFQGSLPPAPNIINLHRRWQLLYTLLYEYRSIKNINLRNSPTVDEEITIDDSDITHASDAEFYEVCDELQKQIDTWLDSSDFRHIERQLRMRLTPQDQIRVIIQTEDYLLKKIPWHTWRFFQDYPQAEVALSAIEFEPGIQTINSGKQVRILAILGDSQGIDVDTDRKILSTLPDAHTVFLTEPKRQELSEQLWDEQGWDILFFAGHSSSHKEGESGYIHINPNEHLTIPQLRNALNKARERGLQLAIFNSCDGLGLAQQLKDLHIPQVIVMREPVPDRVAQEFLKRFLRGYAYGKSFYLAVREAREQLQGLESEFPGASWLAAICQNNPGQVPPTWDELRDRNEDVSQTFSSQRRSPALSWKVAVLVSFLVTIFLMGMRSLGTFQGLELIAFDHLVRLRPPEKPDKRILIVGITEEDFNLKEQSQPIGSISNVALEKLLDKLKSYEPAAIGLDLYRYLPSAPKNTSLAKKLSENDNFFAICKVSEENFHKGIGAPPEIPKSRHGFSDVIFDQYNVLRRHLIALEPSATSPCATPYSFNSLLSFYYLNKKGYPISYTRKGDLQIGKVIFTRLRSQMGGYQQLDDNGYQILLNYRFSNSPPSFAEQVSLEDVLTGKVDANVVKNRIIIIGVVALSAGDKYFTPYSTDSDVPGVILQAQMVSQIISAVEDGRPLLWVLPLWGEFIWIWGWALAGAVIAWRCKSILLNSVTSGTAVLISYAICYIFLLQGCWLALIPAVFSLTLASGSVVIIRFYLRQHALP